MKYRFWIVALLLIGLAATSPAADSAKRWTLEECLRNAGKQPNRVRASEWQYRSAEAGWREERVARYGSVDATGTYSHSTDVQTLSIPISIPGMKIPETKFGDGNVYDLAVTAKIPLFTGGALKYREQAARSGADAAQYDWKAEKASFAAEVRRAFYQVLAGEAALKIATNNRDKLLRHKGELEDAVTIGAVSREALIQNEVALKQAESSQIVAEGDLKAARIALCEITKIDESNAEFDGNLEMSLLTRFDSISVPTNDHRGEFAAMQHRVAQATWAANAVRGSWYPSVAAQATYHYAKPGVQMIKNEWMSYGVFGVSASWTMWDWFARDRRIEKARNSENALRFNNFELSRNLKTAAKVVFERLETAKRNLAVQSSRMESVQTRAGMVEERWKQGQATESEWQDAQDDVTQAHENVLSATVRLRLAEVEWLVTDGAE